MAARGRGGRQARAPLTLASRIAVPARARSASQSSRVRGASSTGTELRPHCSHAPSAMRRHRRSRASALPGSSRTTPRAVHRGTIRVTPSSTLFCTANSMRSPRLTPSARTMARGDSGSAGTGSINSTCTSLRRTEASIARYSSPRPSNNRIAVPDFRRSTPAAWRAAPGPRTTRRPPEWWPARSASTRKRGSRIVEVWQNPGRHAAIVPKPGTDGPAPARQGTKIVEFAGPDADGPMGAGKYRTRPGILPTCLPRGS